MRSCTRTSRCSTTRAIDRSRPWRSIVPGASASCHAGWAMAKTFEYAQAEEIRDAFARNGVRYLFLGKSGAILLGYPDTTQDADLFVEKSPANGAAIVVALGKLGFDLTDAEHAEIQRGKDFVQLKKDPLISIWCLRRRVSSGLKTPGSDGCLRMRTSFPHSPCMSGLSGSGYLLQ